MGRLAKVAAGFLALFVMVGVGITVTDRTLAQNNTSIAYIDTIRLWNELPQMQEMREILENETQEQQTKYDAEAKKLDGDEAKLELFQRYQQELDARKDALFAQALEETNYLIELVAKEQKVTVVLEKQGVLYGGLDLTDLVIKAAAK